MRRLFLVLAALAFCLALFPAAAAAQGEAVEVNSAQLIEDWQEYDGREVIYRGEAVGDVMSRGDRAWVTVNDDDYSLQALREAGELRGGNSGIGILLPSEEAERIETVGRYATRGDLVEVRGVFYADDAENGGDFAIHAASLKVLEPGRRLETSPGAGRYIALAASLAFLLLSLIPILQRRAREWKRARALLAEEDE